MNGVLRRAGVGNRARTATNRDTDPDRLIVMIGAIRTAVVFPFRLLFRVFDVAGRASSVLLGFVLMVSGTALAAGPMLWVGLSVFLFGLYLTLRALG